MRPISSPGSALRGRRRECEALDRLLDEVRAGHSSVVVLRGEPGVGKSALLNYVCGPASGCRIARVAGVESEAELPFAGLHQLCTPMLDRLEGLPGPQQDALETAFGLREGGAPDRFLVGLAVLTLLSEAAVERPLVCLVDDVQWLDRASVQALEFVARRVMADPVAVVFAVRGTGDAQELRGLPELVVSGVGDADARLLLEAALHGRLDERVRDRFIAETRGNPLALLELPRGLTAAELAGGFAVPAQPLARRIEHSFHRRLRALPGDTATPADGGSGARRGRDVALARGRAARHRAGRRNGRRGRGADRPRRPGAVPPSAGAIGSTRRRRPGTARPYIARRPRRPIRRATPAAVPGIAPARPLSRTKQWPVSWSAPPPGPKAAEEPRRRPRSWNERPS